jgi:hypothetical protein
MYDDPIYARVINLILIFFLLICFRTNARHGVWGALPLSHNTSIVQLPLVRRKDQPRQQAGVQAARESREIPQRLSAARRRRRDVLAKRLVRESRHS